MYIWGIERYDKKTGWNVVPKTLHQLARDWSPYLWDLPPDFGLDWYKNLLKDYQKKWPDAKFRLVKFIPSPEVEL